MQIVYEHYGQNPTHENNPPDLSRKRTSTAQVFFIGAKFNDSERHAREAPVVQSLSQLLYSLLSSKPEVEAQKKIHV